MIPKVSIIMTAYNAAETIEKAVNSILAQQHTNFECIIINDNSSDNTLDILKKFKKKDQRIRVITSSENYGTYVCKNYGMKVSTGDYFLFHDSDDYCSPKYIIGALYPLKIHSDLKVSYSGVSFVNAHSSKHLKISYQSSCFSREVFNEVGYFDSVRFSADNELRLRFFAYYGICKVFENIDFKFYFRTIKSDSLTTRSDSLLNGLERDHYKERIKDFHDLIRKKAISPYISFPLQDRPFDLDDESIKIGKEINLKSFKEI